MELDIYQVDAFAAQVFKGNPAAVIPLENWLSDDQLQVIAAENNLSETAYFVKQNDSYLIRWFTPLAEVDLCGHATLASAFVLFNCLGFSADTITFNSRSGPLIVSREGDVYSMDFPAQPAEACELPAPLKSAFNHPVQACFKSEDYILLFEDEQAIRRLTVDLAKLKQLDLRGVVVTAKSHNYDFVCRFFAPRYGIDEDPVTGSAYTQLAPYWAEELSKNQLKAAQLSARGGELACVLKGDRVLLSGQAVLYMKGTVFI
ncbi:MAG: PhzF family phenazine biosynthesis protein [Gammaproteobacteria bacterium]|nr:PhzF family phenazine biosynthesis protein [Gammaproteobacteria bacterium]